MAAGSAKAAFAAMPAGSGSARLAVQKGASSPACIEV